MKGGGPYSVVCGYAGCLWQTSNPSPHLTICKLRWHLEREHSLQCPLCAHVLDPYDDDPASLARHMAKHDLKTNPPLPQHLRRLRGLISYKCPCGRWKSPPLPIDKAYKLYLEHCRGYHAGGLACAFCSEVFPDWGPLAHHVKERCPLKDTYPQGQHPLSKKLSRRKD